jgi:hypothetical protein
VKEITDLNDSGEPLKGLMSQIEDDDYKEYVRALLSVLEEEYAKKKDMPIDPT